MYVEIKYLNLLSVRLEKFKKKKEFLWNFRCPVCGDSQKNKSKAREEIEGNPLEIRGNSMCNRRKHKENSPWNLMKIERASL